MFVHEGKLFVFDVGQKKVDTWFKPVKKHLKKSDPEERKVASGQKNLFYVLSLLTMMWSTWRADEVPQLEDFAHCFDSTNGVLWMFGGYLKGNKSNMLIKI